MSTLKRSKDRKVTTAVSGSGKEATIQNAFGLPSGKAYSCPGATSVCERICYAGKIEKMYTSVSALLLHNFNTLKDADFYGKVELLSEMISEFRADSVRKGTELKFRIHWDGDFFSLEYAYAWARVVSQNADIQFWVYTRSFDCVEAFVGLENISVYLSTDSDNVRAAVATKRDFPFVQYAALAQTFADAADMIDEKSYRCPELRGSIPLIDKKGSACVRCGVCVTGRGNVTFSIGRK